MTPKKSLKIRNGLAKGETVEISQYFSNNLLTEDIFKGWMDG